MKKELTLFNFPFQINLCVEVVTAFQNWGLTPQAVWSHCVEAQHWEINFNFNTKLN